MKSNITLGDEDKTLKKSPSRESTTESQASSSTTEVSDSEISDSESTAVDDSTEESPESKKGGAPKADHLLGKINNLLTTDLTAVSNSYQTLTLRTWAHTLNTIRYQ